MKHSDRDGRQPGTSPKRGTSTGLNVHRSEEGFTLIELLIMLAIMAMLAALVGPRVINYLGSSKVHTAKIQAESIAAALQLYRVDNGRYPTTSEGLRALVERPASGSSWNGPYLDRREVPRDPWGRDYLYQSPGQAGGFEIQSLGADNQKGGTGENADVALAR